MGGPGIQGKYFGGTVDLKLIAPNRLMGRPSAIYLRCECGDSTIDISGYGICTISLTNGFGPGFGPKWLKYSNKSKL